MGEYHSLISKLSRIGEKIREVTLEKVQTSQERDLIKARIAVGDEEYVIDQEPGEILMDELDKFGEENKVSIEVIGEAVDPLENCVGEGNLDWIVHADVVDGTRETTHRVGASYFEAGVMPWRKNPTLADTLSGVVVVIGHDPITGTCDAYHNGPSGSYRVLGTKEKGKIMLRPTKQVDFNDKGFFNVVRSFRGTGVLALLHDRMLEELYGKPSGPDVFHREVITSCGELLHVAAGNSRGVMDLRPAVGLIAEKLGIEGYESPAGLCMHPYDLSGIWPIFRDTIGENGEKPVIMFLDERLEEVKPEEIEIRNVEKDVGYLACGNRILFDKARDGLRKVLGNNYL